MDSLNFTSLCRLCLINRTNGYGVKSFSIDESIQKNFEEFTFMKLVITPSRPKLICQECKYKFDSCHQFRSMIIHSQFQLNTFLPNENLETCLVTVKQEDVFVDESYVVVKIEPEEELVMTIDPVTNTAKTTLTKTKKQLRARDSTSPIMSLKKLIVNSYNANSPETTFAVEGMTKRGRPRKSPRVTTPKKSNGVSLLKIQKVEVSHESGPSLFDQYEDLPTNGSSEDNLKLEKEDEAIEQKEVPAKLETFAICSICPKAKKVSFKDEDDQKIHNELVHEDVNHPFKGPYKCKSCPKTITSEIKIRKHIRQFHLFKNEKLCTTCGKTFYDRRAFYCHIDKNHGIRNVTCPVEGCGKMFNGKMNLGKHLKTHLPDGERKIYVCDKCGSRYINKDNIKPHILLKCDGRTFKDHTLIKPRRKLNKLKCYTNLGI